ncbi:hypothetical protein PPERSA_13018 [Pseudocohnilembus persalinus]|uniref:Uncharacterized protein n=1 Tax=Pseudocohnilembus persalinus TaxID=266149 RepID=A0A0V0R1Z0_PSEPJ|nr:hypothetical protein PPERSA_13018 [Pseudocohnilembus persalinus]|eukprot:KRX08537.1 hypothetical protein PPERSA_13018 [Pseudocohnilembus persalinus]
MLRSSNQQISQLSQSNIQTIDQEQFQQSNNYHPDQLEARLERIGDNLQNIYNIDKKKRLKYIDIEGLGVGKLAKDETFSYLKNELQKWKQLQLQNKPEQITFVEFKNKLYEELTFQLNEIVQTKQKYNQQKFLTDVKYWYNQQVAMMKSQDSSQKCKPISFQRSQVQFYNQDLAFSEKNRTKYNNIEPAEDRVKYFGRKLPQNLQNSMQESFLSKPTTAQASTSQNWFTNSLLQNRKEQMLGSQEMNNTFRPGSTISNFRMKHDNLSLNDQNQFLRNNLKSADSQLRPDTGFLSMKSNQSGWGTSMNFGNFKTVVINDKIAEKDENGKIIEEKYVENDTPSRREILLDQEQQIQNGQEVKSAYRDYVSTQSIPELRMEQKWLHNRHKELQQKREDEEFVKYMQNWSTNKAQYEEEMIKKHQYYLHGSKFFNMQIQKKDKQKKEECSEEDFKEVFVDQQEDQDELEFQKYLNLKNNKNTEKQKNKVFQSERVQTFLEQQRESLTDIKDEKASQLIPSMASFDDNYKTNKENKKSYEVIEDKLEYEDEEQDKQKQQQQKFNIQNQKSGKNNFISENQKEEDQDNSVTKPKKIVFGNFKNQKGIKSEKFFKKPEQVMHNNLIISVENRAAIQKAEQMRQVQTANDVTKRDHRNIGDLELEMKRERIAKIRKMRGKIIGQQESKIIDEEPIVIQKRKDLSLSVYNRKNNPFKGSQLNTKYQQNSIDNNLARTKSTFNFGPASQTTTNFSNSAYQFYKNKTKLSQIQNDQEWKSNKFSTNGRYRPFSSIYGSISSTDIKKSQMHDIRQSKNAMAKSGLKINTKTLSQALLTPEALPLSDLAILPRDDQRLFSNPYMIVKKKKKQK